jgi:hypothetical protein
MARAKWAGSGLYSSSFKIFLTVPHNQPSLPLPPLSLVFSVSKITSVNHLFYKATNPIIVVPSL